MSTIAVPSSPATRIRCESGRNATSRRKFGAENGYRTTGPPPAVDVPDERDRLEDASPRQFGVRHRGDVSAVRAEREACRRAVVEPRQRSATTPNVAVSTSGVERLDPPDRRCDDITARRPSGLTALETWLVGPGWRLRLAGRDVVPAQGGRVAGPLASRVVPSGVKPRSRNASVSLRMTARGVGAALDRGEQVLPCLRRVFEVSPLDGQEQRLVVVVHDQCLRADTAGLGEGAGGVGSSAISAWRSASPWLRGERGLALGLLLLLLGDRGLAVGVAPLHERDAGADDRHDERRGEHSDDDPTAAGAHDLVPIDLARGSWPGTGARRR